MKVGGGLKLLLWKNWLLQRRHPIQTFFEIAVPALFASLLVIVRSLVIPVDYVDPTIYSDFLPGRIPDLIPPDLSINNTRWVVAYTPNHAELNKVMERAAWTAVFQAVPFDTEEDLMANLTSEAVDPTPKLGGVIFRGDFNDSGKLPENIEMRIRFPSIQYIVYVETNTWMTDDIYPDYPLPGPRSKNNNQGGPPGYADKGWLAVQHSISMAMIELLQNEPLQKVNVEMRRYPYPPYKDDPLIVAMEDFLSLNLMVGFVYMCINAIRAVTTEKEKQLKESMKIMGLPGWLHWSAWFLNFMTILLISCVLIVILLTVDWYGNGVSIFTYSHWSIILVFLILYAISTVTFSFMVSTFFSKANTAAMVGGIAWFFSYAPYYFVSQSYEVMSLSSKIFSCLAANTAMSFGCLFIVQFEGKEEGAQWYNLFQPAVAEDDFSLGASMVMLVFDSILYMIIALYVEAIYPGDFGVPLPWYFPFQKSFWFPKKVKQMQSAAIVQDASRKHFYEDDPTHLKAGIEIINLRKVFKGKVAVDNLNLSMYEGHITALLGHNGAGKTTTMSMLTGLLTPTQGTAIVGGCDVSNDITGARESLGLCPQHNILFDELTVEEHLRFFCKIKGLSAIEERREVEKYIKLLDFESKAKCQSHTLSGGMKRKLSVGVALCGGSKVVMLDEPTSGMDPSARRTLWDILEAEKSGRTLLLTTHFMDEADLLGDRIAIMSNGRLQCVGSSFFLKKKYGSGYQLGVAKSSDCNVNTVTSLLKSYVPGTILVQDIGSELSYRLPEDDVKKFQPMLADLETKGSSIGVLGFGVSLTTMEEVFVKAGIDEIEEANRAVIIQQETTENYNEYNYRFYTPRVNIKKIFRGPQLMWNQIYAMMMKYVLSTVRNWILYLIQIAIPVVFLVLVIVLADLYVFALNDPEFQMTLNTYPNTITTCELSESNTTEQASMYNQYIQLLKDANSGFIEVNNTQEYMINKGIENMVKYKQTYVAGATFDYDNEERKTSITAWFSNEPLHAPPLALNLIHNSLLHHFINPNYTIKLYNDPLPFDSQSKVMRQLSGTLSKGFQYAFNIGFSMCFVSSFYLLFYIRERATKAKHLQVVSGVRGWIFWTCAYVWDLITFLGPNIAIIIVFAAFQEEGLRTVQELGRVFLCLLFFAWGVLPLMYLCSRLFSTPSNGFTRLAIIATFLGPAAFMVVVILQTPGLGLLDVAKILNWVFMIFPHYSLTMAIYGLYQTYLSIQVCTPVLEYCGQMVEAGTTNACCREPEQCPNGECLNWTDDYFAWYGSGISRQLAYMGLEGYLLFCLVVALEYPPLNSLLPRFISYITSRGRSHVSEDGYDSNEPEDGDVTNEKDKIKSMDRFTLKKSYQVVLKSVSKRYGSLLAVKDICIGIKQGECFGLLGINGAGKTTTFKMLTGDEEITIGEGYLSGLSLRTEMKKVHQMIGYCPQFDAILEELTGRETITMFCLLRGVPWQECAATVERLSTELTFTKHIDKRVKEYSGGNKRKLSTAVALVGDPPVVLLDEPTTGMDPVARRQLWDVVCKARDSGKSIILTSHSMEECEALCTRLAVMVNGEFKCLGSAQYLKSKFAEGYTLIIKIARSNVHGGYDLTPAKKFILDTFTGSVLKEEVQGMLTYYIPANPELPWSKMFGLLENSKTLLSIEDYSLGQTTLEQVFLSFTKSQRHVQL